MQKQVIMDGCDDFEGSPAEKYDIHVNFYSQGPTTQSATSLIESPKEQPSAIFAKKIPVRGTAKPM
jgi:hypothetical protein